MGAPISNQMADQNPEVLLNTVIPLLKKETEAGKFNGQLDKASYEKIMRQIMDLTAFAKSKMAEANRSRQGPPQVGSGPRPDLVQGLPIMGPGGPRPGPWMDRRGPAGGPQMPLPNQQQAIQKPMPSER